MAIKILMTLEGKDQIKGDLADIGKAVDDFTGKLKDIAPESSPLVELTNNLKQTTPAIDEATKATHGLHEAFQILHPIMRAAGIEMQNFTGFARLAGVGALGLGTAIGGALIIGIGRLEESTARLKGQLTDVFGGGGQTAFLALDRQAKEFGTTVGELVPGLVALQTGLNNINKSAAGFVALRKEDLPGAEIAKNVDLATTAYENFIKLLRAGRLTQDDAKKSADAFFNAFKDGGPITSQALKALPPGTLELIKEALGGAGQSAKDFFAAVDSGAIPLDKFVALIGKFGDQAQKAFDTKAVKTMGDAFQDLLNTLTSFVSGKTWSDAVIAGLDSIAAAAKRVKDNVNESSDALDDLRGQALLRATGGLTTGPTLEQAGLSGAFLPTLEQARGSTQALGKNLLDVGQSLQKLGADGVNAGQKVAQGAQTAAQAWKQTKETFDEFGNSLAQQGAGGEAFKGRLNQIAVSVPQLAGEGGGAGTPGGKFIDNFFTQASDAFPDASKTLDDDFQQLAEHVNQTLGQPPDWSAWTQSFDDIKGTMEGTANDLWNSLNDILTKAIQLNIQIPDVGQGGGFGGFAAGGLVSGPGTGSSDSILAYLSNREFVMNARAVAHYGSGFMNALNLMQMPRFADGGQVSSPQQSPVTFVIDRQAFNMSASEGTIKALSRFAVNSQLTSSGRKPSWVR